MPLPRLLGLWLGPVAAAVVLVPFFAQRGDAALADGPRPSIVAEGRLGATATRSDGSARTELPWLLPGDGDVAVSPDGGRVAFTSARTGNREIYVADGATGDVQRLTASRKLDDRHPAWSDDGRRIAWQSGRPGRWDVYAMRSDGTRKRLVAGGPGEDLDPAWSPDGRRIAFASARGGGLDLWSVSSAGGEPELLLDAVGAARAPAWSPDGRRLAFSAAANGRTHIWVAPLATLAVRQVTHSAQTDLRPDWSPDGTHLAFTRSHRGRTRTWIVRVSVGPATPVAGTDGDVDPDWSLASPAVAPGPEALLPDLDQRAPTDLVVLARQGGFHLGFASAVDSIGRGPLHIRGWRPSDRRTMRADQLIARHGGGSLLLRDVGTLLYQTHPPHRHWHFQQFESYELRRASDHALVGRDRKSGFCLIDRYGRSSVRVPNAGPPRFVTNCGAGQRDLRRVEQGSSPGYVDRYPAFFHGQDIEVTRVPAGTFVLVHRANPTRRVRESSYANNAASVRLRLTWPTGGSAPPRVIVLRRCPASERCPLP
jgi:hypothetical protein